VVREVMGLLVNSECPAGLGAVKTFATLCPYRLQARNVEGALVVGLASLPSTTKRSERSRELS
jgi:hypothetical protein